MQATELIAVVLALLVFLVSLFAFSAWSKARRAVNDADAAVFRLKAVSRERELVIKRAEQIGKTLEAGTAAVAFGTDIAQSTHNVIADSVFGVLNSFPETRETSAVVKGVHDATADGVYMAIGEVNKAIGGVLKGFANPSARKPRPPEDPDSAAKG